MPKAVANGGRLALLSCASIANLPFRASHTVPIGELLAEGGKGHNHWQGEEELKHF